MQNMDVFNATCVQEGQWEVLVFLPFLFICALLNLVVFVATIVNSKKLRRHSYMFICVDSTLLSNVVFLALEIWIFMDQYLGTFEFFGSAKRTVWTVCQTALVSMLFVMCGNIGALLFVVLDSTYFVGRSVNRKATNQFVNDSSEPQPCRRKRWVASAKKRRAIFLVVVSWVGPFILATIAVFKLSCQDVCIFCPGGRVTERHCPLNLGCSQVWPPIHHIYLGISVGTWFLEVISLLAIIFAAVRAFNKVMAPPSPQAAMESVPQLVNSDKGDEVEAKPSSETETNQVDSRMVKIQEENKASLKTKSQRKTRGFRFHSRIRFMMVITATFVACTLPTIITLLMDMSNYEINYDPALYTSFVFVFLYTVFCPVLLVKFLPNLRSALLNMFRSCINCSPSRGLRKRPSMSRRNSRTPA